MTRLSNLTSRNALIALHDAVATALALYASFYLRFDGGELFYARAPLLLHSLISQDMLLGSTIILLLGILTVIGTLLSDLLLMWIDPRIRAGQLR